MAWLLTRLGNAKGVASVDGNSVVLAPGAERTVKFREDISSGTVLSFQSERGKLGDSEDSFLFFCTAVHPDMENFVLSGSFTLTNAGRMPGWQSGFGIFAVDTVASPDGACRFRNLLSVSRHRGLVYDEYECGVRVVSGHTDPSALQCGDARKADASRVFRGTGLSKTLQAGETVRFTLQKTDQGFSASAVTPGGEKTFFFPGCDFLSVQDPEALYVGFGVAGSLSVQVSGLSFALSPGMGSHTPPDALQSRIPEYPFSEEQLSALRPPLLRRKRAGTQYASPSGSLFADGTRKRPFALQTALWLAERGSEVVLLPGVYSPEKPLFVPQFRDAAKPAEVTVRAAEPGSVILDGSRLRARLPLMILRGDGWVLEQLIFQRSPSVGLLVCGSGNRILQCTARENGDTGILICSFPGTSREDWPAGNLVSRCDSFSNRDPAGCNADGFGAKLSVGAGNLFFQCIAHHNADDGFDLYTKRVLGPIGSVALEECIAYENGSRNGPTVSGSGFKLGGEGIPVRHTISGCLAFANCDAGFHANSNPAPKLSSLISWQNGENRWEDNFRLRAILDAHPELVAELLPRPAFPGETEEESARFFSGFVHCDTSVVPTRRADGSIDRHGLFEPLPRPD